jgi:hypothetical protein
MATNDRTLAHRFNEHRSFLCGLCYRVTANRRRTAAALERFLQLLGNGDVRGIEQMLAADVRMVADGGGEFTATLRPVIGRPRGTAVRAPARLHKRGRAFATPGSQRLSGGNL